MNRKTRSLFSFLILSLLLLFCAPSDTLKVLHQVTGPIQTNCYLLYDTKSKEAALIDIGGPIDSLLTHITRNNLKLKYIFATHCHMDHIEGVKPVKRKFPNALLCYNKAEHEDFFIFVDWMEEHMDPKELQMMKNYPGLKKWFEYDLTKFDEPDLYVEDNQIYRLGNAKIKTILSPGHSRGHMCYHAGNILFTGDVFGHVRLLGASKEEQVRSVKRLFTCFPDETKIYPGHGPFTNIGSKKKEKKWNTLSYNYH